MWRGYILVALAGTASAYVATDEVMVLPGWSGKLPSRMFSGYLDATPQGETVYKLHMHYTFWESEGDPAKDPLLIWSNGGPGAGSEFGAFTELGPLLLYDASMQTKEYNTTGIPTLFQNPQAWTKVASLLIYDAPPPVGYSYCNNNPGGDGYSCGDWDDFRTARSVHTFVENFMRAFPEYAQHDLYLSGESYAGVYIPMLAREILQDTSSPTAAHLRGMLIGDGCTGTDVLCGNAPGHNGPWFHMQFFHGHGAVSDKLYDEIVDTCGVAQLKAGITDPKCESLVKSMDTAIGGYFDYAYYDECSPDTYISPAPGFAAQRSRRYWSSVPPLRTAPQDGGLGGALNDYPCGGVHAMLTWLNASAVKKALNVPPDAYFFLTDNGVGFNYSLTEKNLMPFYQQVVNEKRMRVVVYNGDTGTSSRLERARYDATPLVFCLQPALDSCVWPAPGRRSAPLTRRLRSSLTAADPGINSFVSQNWTVALGFKETQAWRPWTVDGKQQMGGYVTRYENNFDFLTIRGAGHMVPEFKPTASLAFLTAFLKNEDYMPYAKPPPKFPIG